jgi:hypothetical protein
LDGSEGVDFSTSTIKLPRDDRCHWLLLLLWVVWAWRLFPGYVWVTLYLRALSLVVVAIVVGYISGSGNEQELLFQTVYGNTGWDLIAYLD